jgi:hypothetical protein
MKWYRRAWLQRFRTGSEAAGKVNIKLIRFHAARSFVADGFGTETGIRTGA